MAWAGRGNRLMALLRLFASVDQQVGGRNNENSQDH